MKRSANQILLTIASVATLALSIGCHQDPFAEKSDAIKNGIPPELQVVPRPEKPRDPDALHIDALDFYSFKEQVTSEITISGRVLESNGTFTLSVDNLAKFPGATFDAAKGTFKWTPPRETTGSEYGVERRLVVRLTSPSPTGGTTEGTTKAILIYVTRAEVDPEIISVDDLVKVPVREGELYKFKVVVKDPDSADADGARPRLLSLPAKKGVQDVSGLVYMEESGSGDKNPQQDATDKHVWTYKMVLDLRVPADQRGRDFTRSQENFKFGLQVVSRYGRMAVKDVDVAIRTDVLKPDVSWFDPIEVVAGQENVVQFTVYDPYAEGKLSVNFVTRVDQLPGSAISVCKTASREGNILCRISWKPSATTKGDFPIEFEAMNQSKVAGDTKFIKETFKRLIRVIPGPDTPPVQVPTNPPGPKNPAPAPGPANPVPAPGPSSTTGGGN